MIFLDIRKQRRRKRAARAKKFASSTGGANAATAVVVAVEAATEDQAEVKPSTTAKRQHLGGGGGVGGAALRNLQRLLSRKKAKATGFQQEDFNIESTEQEILRPPRKALVQTQIDVEKVCCTPPSFSKRILVP